MPRLRVVTGDITRLAVDAVVNAANPALLGGGGVDGAIHAAAGPDLLRACRALPEVRPGVRCPTGEARITPGFGLPARHVIHTVGPVWRGGGRGEADALAACYRAALALARDHDARSLAFPAISTGVYGFPFADAAHIAVSACRAFLAAHPVPGTVLLVAFGEEDADRLRAALAGGTAGGRVRRAGAGDEAVIRDLRIRALTDAPLAFASTLERELARTPQDWRRWIEDGATFLWEPGGDPGAGAAGIAAGARHWHRPDEVFLMSMWVDPSHRGTGAADALIDAVLAWAREAGYGRVRLEVGEANAPAQRVYRRHGFRETGVRTAREPDGLPEIEMLRDLRTEGGGS